jgi:hypothetical protein
MGSYVFHSLMSGIVFMAFDGYLCIFNWIVSFYKVYYLVTL